ncbi:integral membrane protein 2C [Diprion similis]|uniref:integral membrane protein 2C n=1 Tax=Diprion similis TaxID=362088 RepID=UPI001EF8D9C5|nr:integral membrane protein 2C [Diprion similis]
MTIITKAITEKKAADIVELPLVVDEIPPQGDVKDDPEGQYATLPRPTRYVLRCRQKAQRLNSLTTLCLFLTALLVMSIGVIGGVYIYKQYARDQMHRFRGWCDIPYYKSDKAPYTKDALDNSQALFSDPNNVDEDAAIFAEKTMELQNDIRNYLTERLEIDLENEDYEKIDVPILRGGRQGRYIHDFNTNKTGIIDVDSNRCFVMPLNRERVLPPRSLYDLVNKMYRGYYEVDTEVVRETMKVVTPRITDLSGLGPYIARECRDMPTYRLEKVVHSVAKRSVKRAPFVQFSGKDVWELDIENLDEFEAYQENSIK